LFLGLMCWRELDVMVLMGGDFSPGTCWLLQQIVGQRGYGLEYHDERGSRCLIGQIRDERYHVPFTVERAGQCWRTDLTLW